MEHDSPVNEGELKALLLLLGLFIDHRPADAHDTQLVLVAQDATAACQFLLVPHSSPSPRVAMDESARLFTGRPRVAAIGWVADLDDGKENRVPGWMLVAAGTGSGMLGATRPLARDRWWLPLAPERFPATASAMARALREAQSSRTGFDVDLILRQYATKQMSCQSEQPTSQ